jgi:hypothetical protein
MIRLRTKLWFGLCGVDALLMFAGMVGHNFTYAMFAFGLLMFSWYVAHMLLDADAEELMSKLERRE